MASPSRQRASRENGRKGRGPKTQSGKARSSVNARRHGLSVALSQSSSAIQAIEELASLLAGDDRSPVRLSLCRDLAECQLDLLRIRRARTEILRDESRRRVRRTKKDFAAMRRDFKFKVKTAPFADPQYDEIKRDAPEFLDFFVSDYIFDLSIQFEQQILEGSKDITPLPQGFSIIIGKLNALERYERRALSRRGKALAALNEHNELKSLGEPLG